MKNIDIINIILVMANVTSLFTIIFGILELALFGMYMTTLIHILITTIVYIGTVFLLIKREKPEPILEEDIYL